jgi:uncharacterized protein YaeQ
MALRSTVFKAQLQLADVDHGYYADHALTLARHPSETDERMMVRLVAWALNAHAVRTLAGGDAALAFGAGLSDPDEPDLLLSDYSGRARLWIEVGQPDDKPLTRACSRADAVIVYAFGAAAEVWWRGVGGRLARLERLQVWRLPSAGAQALAGLAARTMQLQATLLEGVLHLSDAERSVVLEAERWK